VGGGFNNTVGGYASTVGGGRGNTTSSYSTYATVAGGYSNTANGPASFVGSGAYNTADAWYATVPGGYDNRAAGEYSLAAGEGARALHDGVFVWDGDYQVVGTSTLNSSAAGQFLARAPGGFWFGDTNGDTTPTISAGVFMSTSTGAYLSTGGTWTNASDRNLKENFTPVDQQAVLEQVAQLPITTWNYKAQEANIRHMGPAAQDFYAAFGLGEDNTHISTVDAAGVSLAAIQALYAQNRALKHQVVDQQTQIEALQRQNADLEARVAALERAQVPAPYRQHQASLPFASWLGGLVLVGGLLLWPGKGGWK